MEAALGANKGEGGLPRSRFRQAAGIPEGVPTTRILVQADAEARRN